MPSSEGAQQGAPLSPLFFSLAIHDIITSCPTSLVNVWYLDDGTLVGDLNSLRTCVGHLVVSRSGDRAPGGYPEGLVLQWGLFCSGCSGEILPGWHRFYTKGSDGHAH